MAQYELVKSKKKRGRQYYALIKAENFRGQPFAALHAQGRDDEWQIRGEVEGAKGKLLKLLQEEVQEKYEGKREEKK